MAENNGQNQPPKTDDKKPTEVTVKVDNEQTRILMEQLKREEEARKKAEEELKKIAEEKTKAEADAKAKGEEAEDLKGKLEIISEKELEKKRAVIREKAKTLIQDEARVKEISDKLKDPEQVAATEYMLKVLEDTLAKGEEQHKKIIEDERKKAEEAAKAAAGTAPPAGSAPLNDAQKGGKQGYDSAEAMIVDLRKREHSSDPAVAAEAKAILDELFKKWAGAVKKEFNEMKGFKGQGQQPTIEELVKKRKSE
jgi:membrane protein involved in colicin uptake